MLVYFWEHNLLVNTSTITHVKVTGRTDRFTEDHVIIKFVDGSFVEFPPEITLQYVWNFLSREEK